MRLHPKNQHHTTPFNNTPVNANIFCFAALADKNQGTIYTDCTGNLPTRALDNQQLFFVAYHYDINYIFALPIQSTKGDDIIAAFRTIFDNLTRKGFAPTFNVTDNQAAAAIKKFVTSRDCAIQFVEPYNHRVNAAERAIQTFKNHFISGLCTTDISFPLQLWNHLAHQAEITCNLLRRSRLNPNISAYHQLHGHKYNWNAHPLAPPGTRALILNPPALRTSWGPRAIDAWYCGPAMDHYRCSNFYVPETRAMRITSTYELYPTHCSLPTVSPHEHTGIVFNELIRCIAPLPRANKRRMLTKIIHTITEMATTTKSYHAEPDLPWPANPQTSKGAEHHTSTNPTAPAQVFAAPHIHTRHTRANTPITPTVTPTPDPTPTPTTTPTHDAVTQPPRRSERIALLSPRLYSNMAIHHLTTEALNKDPLTFQPLCFAVIHPTTGESITKYTRLQNDPLLRDTWARAFGKEFGNLAQGDTATNTPGTDTIFVLTHEQIKQIPRDRTVTYTRIVVDYRPQKSDPNRVRLTAGGNLIDYPGELTTRTADLTTTKLLWNSVISTKDSRYMCLDIKNFYLGTPMARFEYMKIPIGVFPQATINQYNLNQHAHNGFIYLEVRKAIYGLPQAGILANQLLKQRLRPFGYFEVAHTPGLWKHITRPIQFTLTVDDFGVKYEGKEHADHLIEALSTHYALEQDWGGTLYCGISLKWDYIHRHVDISMPMYVEKLLARFEHTPPTKPQHSPHSAPSRQFGATAQIPVDHDLSPALPPDRIKRIQQIVGTVMYYARAVDITTLVALSSIAAEQAQATEKTEKHVHTLLDYLATHKNATVRYVASDMVLNIHSDASYLSEPRARSRLGGTYFMGSLPTDGKPIQINGPIQIHASICKFVVTSAAEAELGALFYNIQEGTILRLALEELGHPQPPTPVHCDNITAVGIANDTVKKQRSRAMEMRFFRVTDQVALGNFNVTWHPGQENLADYFTKHFEAKHHQAVRPWYLLMHNSPRILPRALAPSALKGCVGTLPHGYAKSVPLPHLRPDQTPVPQTHVRAQSHPSVAAAPQQRPKAPINRNTRSVDARRAVAS
jgi:hypothetical protein